MQGRLLFIRWQRLDEGRYDVSASIKTNAGRRASVRIGTYTGLDGLAEATKEANERFPKDGGPRMEGGT